MKIFTIETEDLRWRYVSTERGESEVTNRDFCMVTVPDDATHVLVLWKGEPFPGPGDDPTPPTPLVAGKNRVWLVLYPQVLERIQNNPAEYEWKDEFPAVPSAK